MREILFRGRRKDNGEWICGNLTVWSDGSASIDKDPTEASVLYAVDPETVGQYTGLTDKNGKKIFEGDICKDKHNELWKVKFGQYCDCSDGMQVGFHYSKQRTFTNGSIGEELFCMLCSTYHPEAFEVIGNFHDNPELLGIK